MKCIVAGITNAPEYTPDQAMQELIAASRFFSGGKRHYALVKHLLPEDHTWIPVTGDMSELMQAYRQVPDNLLVFASGDPLFYGLANTIRREIPEMQLEVIPAPHSLQTLARKTVTDYSNLHTISVHGRTWQALDAALIRGESLIGVLTDLTKNPAEIARRMRTYGFTNYTLIVGEELDGATERIHTLTVGQAAEMTFSPLNCVLLQRQYPLPRAFGIPDDAFDGLANRPHMITKMPVRMVSLSKLDLHNRQTLWDIGYCTGSVCIEAKNQFPHLQVLAFEKRPECADLLCINTQRFHVPGIQGFTGDFFEQDLTSLARPDAVFIGGHGNRLEELFTKIDRVLLPGGICVLNAVQVSSIETFKESAASLGYTQETPINLVVDTHNPITILTARKPETSLPL